ncbi:MAG: molybdenum cofactor biosynthesis protein MoaE [Candidatus Marinimicrobia bacterium]|nr:molybdenum cofactor biosynthesis protein MoaE [Candidatus Neomarinimicrobiota bacterium]
MVIVEIINSPIISFPSDNDRQQDGAELVFNGRVRDTENGREIVALEYEQYKGMAKVELLQLAENTVNKFPINDLFCKHRVGKVDVGDTSLHVVIWSKHRKEGLNAMTWFISELKKRVPIWKWAIMKDGTRMPSECTH